MPACTEASARIAGIARTSPMTTPDDRDRQTMQHHIAKNRATPGAQRHPNADLLGPKTDAIRDHTVEANGCEQQREQAETRRGPIAIQRTPVND